MHITLTDLILSMIIVILANWVINRLCIRSVHLSLDRLYHWFVDFAEEQRTPIECDSDNTCDNICDVCTIATVTIVTSTHGEVEKYRTSHVPVENSGIITPTGLLLTVKKVTTKYNDIDPENDDCGDTVVNAIVYCE